MATMKLLLFVAFSLISSLAATYLNEVITDLNEVISELQSTVLKSQV